jgi:perosamine synthetase
MSLAHCSARNWSDVTRSSDAAGTSLLATGSYSATSRDELVRHLGVHGVDTRPFFLALHRLPPFREESLGRNEWLPFTDRLSSQGMNLPTYSALERADQEAIAQLIREFGR